MNADASVFFVDDDDALRRATQRLLADHGFDVRAYASAEEYLSAYDPRAPGCLLLDLRMPGASGLEVQLALEQRGGPPPIVFLTGHADVPSCVEAMKHGAFDFLEKPVSEARLVTAITRALERDRVRRRELAERAVLERRHETLTPREREVLIAIIAGHLNKQTAFRLGISERTVKLHRARVLEKMRADSVADLVRMAARLGIDSAAKRDA